MLQFTTCTTSSMEPSTRPQLSTQHCYQDRWVVDVKGFAAIPIVSVIIGLILSRCSRVLTAPVVQGRCQHNITSAFLKMRSDLDPLLKERQTQQTETPAEEPEPPLPKPLKDADKERFQKIDRIIVHVLQKVMSEYVGPSLKLAVFFNGL